jgi:hypothetical protein
MTFSKTKEYLFKLAYSTADINYVAIYSSARSIQQ